MAHGPRKGSIRDPQGLAQVASGLPALTSPAGTATGPTKGKTTMGKSGKSTYSRGNDAPPMADRSKRPGRNTNTSAKIAAGTTKGIKQQAVANQQRDNNSGITGLQAATADATKSTLGFGAGNRKYRTHPGIPMAKGTRCQ